MKYIFIIVLNSLFFTCKAQELDTLNEQQYDVISAFVNQNFDFDDHFYLNKHILQKEFLPQFSNNYKRIIEFYEQADSICNSSKDTLQLEFFCPAAFYREKYVGLFDNDNLKYLEETYNINKTNSFIINKNYIAKPVPIILEHTDDYYKKSETIKKGDWQKEISKFKELPSLEIRGIYFSKDKNIVIVDYMMITETHEKQDYFSILKKEKEVWWRLIGNIASR